MVCWIFKLNNRTCLSGNKVDHKISDYNCLFVDFSQLSSTESLHLSGTKGGIFSLQDFACRKN